MHSLEKTLPERALHAVLYEVCAMLILVPLGSWLLMAIGLGLLAFALYSFAQALWRRIDLQEVLD